MFVVLGFTKPPAIEALSGDSMGIMSVVLPVILFGICFREIKNIFITPHKSHSNENKPIDTKPADKA